MTFCGRYPDLVARRSCGLVLFSLAAAGPILVGSIAAQGANSLTSALRALFYVGFVPLAGLLLLPWAIETKGRTLED